MDVKGPVAPLAELPVADDVDAGLDLLADNLLRRIFQACLVPRLVVGFAGFYFLEEFDKPRRTHQAADVGGPDSIDAAGHIFLPFAPHRDCAAELFNIANAAAGTIGS